MSHSNGRASGTSSSSSKTLYVYVWYEMRIRESASLDVCLGILLVSINTGVSETVFYTHCVKQLKSGHL